MAADQRVMDAGCVGWLIFRRLPGHAVIASRRGQSRRPAPGASCVSSFDPATVPG
jgi:hypothetical protein